MARVASLLFMLFSTIVFSMGVFAQDYQKDPFTLEGQGSLLTVRIVVGDKNAKVYLTGKEALKMDFAKDAKLLQLTAFTDKGQTEELQFVPGEGYYTVKKLPEWQGPYLFKVKAQLKDKTDNIEIRRK